MNTVRVLRARDLPAKVGLSLPTLYAMIPKGEFPKPFALTSRTTGWLESTVDAWIEARAAVPAGTDH